MARQTEEQIRRQVRRQVRQQAPTGSASMPTAAVITAEPMMAAAVEFATAIPSLAAEPGPGRPSGKA